MKSKNEKSEKIKEKQTKKEKKNLKQKIQKNKINKEKKKCWEKTKHNNCTITPIKRNTILARPSQRSQKPRLR